MDLQNNPMPQSQLELQRSVSLKMHSIEIIHADFRVQMRLQTNLNLLSEVAADVLKKGTRRTSLGPHCDIQQQK